MDIGKMKEDNTFYNGFEGEPEVDFMYGDLCLKIWDGYIYALMEKAPLDGKGWHGMTHDYHEFCGPWDTDEADVDSTEYLNDLKQYKSYTFEDANVTKVLDRLLDLFSKASKDNAKVHVVVC
ncbi:MAG: hypothetical protein PUF82_05975 [Lactobacillus equicursoris]|uniref:hypothetical protein n=1 Tax=Lactobacillus equicursoris TaxID=420645 RepID=UPI00242AF3E4|nr:hypothetical protein [Lactobacillus equicursoris]MDD6407528.1 hypothetical protein [Lactobacillus equicursoris]